MDTEELFIDGYNLPKPLTKQETYELLEKVQTGDILATNQLIECNIRLVIYSVVNRFKTIKYDKKELVSVGILGLMKSIEKYDFSKKVEFTTFAKTCIDNEILTFLRQINKHQKIDSLDKIININKDGFGTRLKDVIEDDNDFIDSYMRKEEYQNIREIIQKLPPIDRQIIMLRFGFYNNKAYTQQEISDITNISQSQISRIIKKNIKKITLELTNCDDCISQNVKTLTKNIV